MGFAYVRAQCVRALKMSFFYAWRVYGTLEKGNHFLRFFDTRIMEILLRAHKEDFGHSRVKFDIILTFRARRHDLTDT